MEERCAGISLASTSCGELTLSLLLCPAGGQLNQQHTPAVDHQELARETERLDRELACLM